MQYYARLLKGIARVKDLGAIYREVLNIKSINSIKVLK